MRKSSKPSMFLAILLALVSSVATGQDVLDSLKVMPGSELQGGIGNFGDPTTHHGFTLAINGSLGVSSKSNTFGYDAFAVNGRWIPGTNGLGKRIAIQFGATNWFTPALSAVYRDTVLTETEKVSDAKTVNSVMAGLSFQLAGARDKIKFTNEMIDQLDTFELHIFQAAGQDLLIKSLKEQRDEYMWKEVLRPTLREFSLILGGMFRLGTISTETDVTAIDLFATAAKGKGLFDFVGSIHYLKPTDKDLLAKNATTANLGMFVDLDDVPPVNTMGITFGIGKYNYYKKERELVINESETILIDKKPHTYRFDATLSFSGLFKESAFFGSSIAFRYSNLNHSSTTRESQFSVLLTSKFVNSRSAKKTN